MRAARFHGKGTSLVIEEVERPVPREHEVVVRVAAAGVCGTELHFLDGLLTPSSVPITLTECSTTSAPGRSSVGPSSFPVRSVDPNQPTSPPAEPSAFELWWTTPM